MGDRLAGRTAFALALALDLVGAGAALLVSSRPWQTIVTRRPRPLADTVLHVSGRTVAAGPTALGVVAIAGLVAVLATRGAVRRVIGLLLAIAGAGLIWQSASAASAIGTARARSLVASKHPGIVDPSGTRVDVHALWPALSVVAGIFVLGGGLLVALWGHRWSAMSSRYESPVGNDDPARTDATLWAAIERGEDPTGGHEPH